MSGWIETQSAPALMNSGVYLIRIGDHEMHAQRNLCDLRIDSTTTGPIVILGTKWAVQDIHREPIGARRLHGLDLIFQKAEICDRIDGAILRIT